MEQDIKLLHGKFSISGKPGKVYNVELTQEYLKFHDANWGKNGDSGGVIDLNDVIGCHIDTSVNKQGNSGPCDCIKSSLVSDRTECLLSVYFCPKKKKRFLSSSYERRHCTLTLGLSQHPDYNVNKGVCENWRRTILNLSNNNNNDKSMSTPTDIESFELPLQRKLLVLINPFSGAGKALQIFQNGVSHMLEEADIFFKMVVTEYAGHATEVMRKLDLSSWYGVVIVSGDGLIYEVINGLMSREDWETAISFPIGCIPGGSGNALCLNINYLAGEPVDVNPILHSTFVLIKHRVIPMDLVLVQTQKQQLFSFLSVTWGLIADIDYESERMRVLGATRFTLYFIKRVLSLRRYRAKISFLPVTPYDPNARNQKNGVQRFSKPRRFSMIRSSLTHNHMSSSVCDSGIHGVYTNNDSQNSIQRFRSKSMPAVKDSDSLNDQTTEDISGLEVHDNVKFDLDETDNCFSSSLPNGNHVNEDNASIGSENAYEEMVHTLNNDGTPIKATLLSPLKEDIPSNWVTIEDEFISACALYQPYLGPDNLTSPESRLNDGQIHLLMIRAGIPKSVLVNLFLSFETGDHVSSPYVEMVKVLAFRLEPMGTEGNIMVDGEHVDYGPIQGQVLPGIARIMGVQ
ncbi:sphingosine kinase 1-like isoform X1 [Crassostrea virginica]